MAVRTSKTLTLLSAIEMVDFSWLYNMELAGGRAGGVETFQKGLQIH